MRFFNNETETTVELKRGDIIALADGVKVFIEALSATGSVWFTLNKKFQCVDFKTITKIEKKKKNAIVSISTE